MLTLLKNLSSKNKSELIKYDIDKRKYKISKCF